jgi:hypothetical protein
LLAGLNYQRDMRARLFRERNPAAFGILSEPQPPILAKTTAEAPRGQFSVTGTGLPQHRA